MLFFLFYEEISFLTYYVIPISRSINQQAELNIHTLNFVHKVLFQIPVPFTNHVSSINIVIFAVGIFSCLLGCGLFLPYLKKLRYLFWEKQYAIFSFVYFGNFFFSVYIRHKYNSSFLQIIHTEYVELFLYIVFLLDVLQKRKIMRQIYNKNINNI